MQLIESRPQDIQEDAIRLEDRQALAGRLADVRSVELPDGARVPVDSSYLAARLRDADTDLDMLRSMFDALLDWGDNHVPASGSSADLKALQAILARQEFQYNEDVQNPVSRYLQRIYRWLLEQLSRIMPSAARAGPLFRAFLSLVLAAALAWVLVAVVRSSMRSVVRENEAAEGGELPPHMTSEQARREAGRRSGDGDFRSAVRYLYLAALFTLEEKGYVHPDRRRTNREYLAALAASPALQDRLRNGVLVFDRVWYGFQPLDESAYLKFSESVDRLRRLRNAG